MPTEPKPMPLRIVSPDNSVWYLSTVPASWNHAVICCKSSVRIPAGSQGYYNHGAQAWAGLAIARNWKTLS